MSNATTPYSVVLDPKAYEGIHLLEDDGKPMDTFLHRACMDLLIDVTQWHIRDRPDAFVGGNNFIYFNPDQARNLDYRGPDYFYIKDGVDRNRPRRYWAVWQEGGRTPDVIIELLSPTTEEEDRTTKFAIYEQTLRTPEYFLYDPFTHVLEGFRLHGGSYRPLSPNKHGRLWSEELGLWLGIWEGMYRKLHETFLRCYTRSGKLAPTEGEGERRGVERVQKRLDKVRRRADEEQRRADEEQRCADEERRRREEAEAELARLRAMLQQRPSGPDAPPGSAS